MPIDRAGAALPLRQVKVVDALAADRTHSRYAVADARSDRCATAVDEVLRVAEAGGEDAVAEGAGGEVVGGWQDLQPEGGRVEAGAVAEGVALEALQASAELVDEAAGDGEVAEDS